MHDRLRKITKRNETEAHKPMIKNGKFFVAPPKDGSDIKQVFAHLAAVGAGRKVDKDGYSVGPWTPELLTNAVSNVEGNNDGIDLRTVQLWFQENEKGVSTTNIRWLARVFGCDDVEATSDWQKELSTAQSQLTAKRRNRKKVNRRNATALEDEAVEDTDPPTLRFSLARSSEEFFSRGSPLDLPAFVFAGAVALGFVSFLIGIHSATYERVDGIVKQIGFIWAPNWTVLFMAFMPLFFAFVVELVVFWKEQRRTILNAEDDEGWNRSVLSSSYTYWAVLIICVPIAGLFQWFSVRLMPLIAGVDRTATDWGSLAVLHPEIISVPEAIVFTGIAYLYMCLCFYLYFVGLILLHTLAYDLWEIEKSSQNDLEAENRRMLNAAGLRVMQGIFRCTILGVLIAVCMKVQSFYLTSSATNVWSWLLTDASSFFQGLSGVSDGITYSMPTHYSSLIIAFATCVVFMYGSIRLGFRSSFHLSLSAMTAVLLALVSGYLFIGSFTGFSLLLGVGCVFGIYGLFDPTFGAKQADNLKEDQNVS